MMKVNDSILKIINRRTRLFFESDMHVEDK